MSAATERAIEMLAVSILDLPDDRLAVILDYREALRSLLLELATLTGRTEIEAVRPQGQEPVNRSIPP